MKIKQAHIYGFGKIENVKLHNLTNLTVLFGENESGKTTIITFIKSVLFGFPPRSHGFEPKFHSKYGGRLLVHFSKIGDVSIERVKGKAAGDVTVVMPDGTVGSDKLLAQLLNNLDEKTFTSIYLYNIHELQDVDKLSNEDLNRFLFSTSTIGTDKLLKIENYLARQLYNLFRARGEKLKLNALLIEIEEIYKKLINAKQQNSTYFNLIEERDNLIQQLSEIDIEQTDIYNRLNLLSQWQDLSQHVTERATIKNELEKLGEINFPYDGEAQLKQIQELIMRTETQVASKEKAINQLREQLKFTKPKEEVLAKESEILLAVESAPLYEKLKVDKSEIEVTLANLKTEINTIRDQLHINTDPEELLSINTSILVKDEITNLEQELQRQEIKQEQLQTDLQQNEINLSRLKEEKQQLSKGLLSVEDRLQREQQLTIANNYEKLRREHDDITERLNKLKQDYETEEKATIKAKKTNFKITVVTIIFVLIAIVTYFYDLRTIAFGALSCLILILLFRRPKNFTINEQQHTEQLNYYERKLQTLTTDLKAAQNIDQTKITNQLRADQEQREQLRLVTAKINDLQKTTEELRASLMQQKERLAELYNRCDKFAKQWGLPSAATRSNITQYFNKIDDLKSLLRRQHQLIKKHTVLKENMKSLENKILSLAKHCGENHLESPLTIVASLKRLREQQLTKSITYKEQTATLTSLTNELEQLNSEHNLLKKARQKLFAQAEVTSVTQFYNKAELAKEQKRLHTQLREQELLINDEIIVEINTLFPNISTNGEKEIELCHNKITKLDEQRTKLNERIASLNYEISLLEEGGTYNELQQIYQTKRQQLNDGSLEWARLALAEHILKKTLAIYKKDRLPKLLLRAEKYLATLTNGEYEQIIINEDEFYLLRNDKVKFTPIELSQATAEQVYVALRLALAVTLKEQSLSFPLIIDDSFVNFDKQRTARVVQLLKQISESTQIILFTCHHPLVEQFSEGDIKKLPTRSMKQLTNVTIS